MFYQLFARPRHDHCNIIYDQAQDFVFHRKVELFQYNASLNNRRSHKGNFQRKNLSGDGTKNFAALLSFTKANS